MQHIGFIMDGNRTWAENAWLPKLEWHRRWYDNLERIIDACFERKIPYVSFWALSDDNIKKRDASEVKYLFDLLARGIKKLVKESNKKNVRLYFVWDRSLLRKDCLDAIIAAEGATEKNTGMKCIFAIGYWWQEEIIRAVHALALTGKDMATVTLEELNLTLDTGKFPPPDMIVRTGWHMRHSGYFLFQSPYAEYFFSEKNWPDFDEGELEKVCESYESRIRKFGK